MSSNHDIRKVCHLSISCATHAELPTRPGKTARSLVHFTKCGLVLNRKTASSAELTEAGSQPDLVLLKFIELAF